MQNKFFNYAGSKSKYIDKILPFIDTNKILIEPFVGSGAISLNSNNQNIVISDTNKYIIDTYNGFNYMDYDYYINFINKSDPIGFIQKNKKNYYEYRNYYNLRYNNLDIKDKAMFNWIMLNSCINGMARWGNGGFNQGFGDRNLKIYDRLQFNNLKNSLNKFSNLDISFFNMSHYDNIDSVWFLDPPYISRKMSYIDNFTEDHATMFISTINDFVGDVIYIDTLNDYNIVLLNNKSWTILELNNLNNISPNNPTKTSTKEYMFINFKLKNNNYFN